jgi:outer membrane protein OmpA-like peptidoglycan-associated protein
MYKLKDILFACSLGLLSLPAYADYTIETWTCTNCLYTAAMNERMQLLIADLERQGVAYIRTGDQMEFVLSVDSFFWGTSNLRINSTKIPVLRQVAEVLRSFGNVPITVYGNTDNVGSDQSKLYRSTQQARTIAAYLWASGVRVRNMTIIGCADTDPVSTNKTLDGSAANRRIDIVMDYP